MAWRSGPPSLWGGRSLLKAILLLPLLLLPSACTPKEETLSIAAAASTQYLMEDLIATFKAETGIHATLSTGASGQLVAQILNGAPFDLFFSADMEYPQRLSDKGFVAAGPTQYGQGTLILWTVKAVDISSGMPALLHPDIHTVAIADPETAPYGRIAQEALILAGLWDSLQPKLVFGESISQVNNWVSSGTADAGFTALSVVKAGPMEGKGTFAAVSSEFATPLPQGVALLKHGAQHHGTASRRFWDFVFSAKGSMVLARHGY